MRKFNKALRLTFALALILIAGYASADRSASALDPPSSVVTIGPEHKAPGR